MNVFYILLVVCAAMGLLGWALNRRSFRRVPTISEYEVYLDRGPNAYKYVGRLFAKEDFAFLESVPGGQELLPRLRRERRRLLRLLLADLHREFQALMAVGSLLVMSRTAQDDGFAAELWKQSMIFNSLCFGLLICSYLPFFEALKYNPASLLSHLKTVREATRVFMHALTPSDMDRLRDTLTT